MIYTCTIAPSVDYTTYLDSFESGKLNRAQTVHYYPGGKGINVSRVLARLGHDTCALGYAGGFTGGYIQDYLEKEGITTDFIDTGEVTRINVKIKTQEETELNGPGPSPDKAQLEKLSEKIARLQADDWFVLAGTLPETIPLDFFLSLARLCKERDVRFVLDTSGPALKGMIEAQPYLIKPNEHELGDMFGATVKTHEEAFHYADRLVSSGIRHVIVSMGGKGAIYASRDHRYIAEAPTGQVVNTVGAGDSLVSGFIASYARTKDALQAFRYSVASGSATAFREDLCDKEAVERLLPEVKVTPFEQRGVTK